MKTFSTVLFVDGSPVGYKVCQNDANHIVMNPAENPGRMIIPPVISATNISGSWEVKGTRNQDLIEQVIEGLRYSMDFSPQHFSAAP